MTTQTPDIGYKIYHTKSKMYKHRAGGRLWSEQGDIYTSLAKAKAVLKLHLKGKRKLDNIQEYVIIEYQIMPTGNIIYE